MLHLQLDAHDLCYFFNNLLDGVVFFISNYVCRLASGRALSPKASIKVIYVKGVIEARPGRKRGTHLLPRGGTSSGIGRIAGSASCGPEGGDVHAHYEFLRYLFAFVFGVLIVVSGDWSFHHRAGFPRCRARPGCCNKLFCARPHPVLSEASSAWHPRLSANTPVLADLPCGKRLQGEISRRNLLSGCA